VYSCFCQSDTLNQIDTAGLKQGYWKINGVDIPNRGWCDTCIIEEGTYLNNRREGIWIKYFQDGVTPETKGDYKLGRPNGVYAKFYPNGKIKETGIVIGRKQIGELIMYYESGCVLKELNYDKNGKQEGLQTYYYNCNPSDSVKGQIEFQHKVVNGVWNYDKALRYYPNGEKKEIITYSEDGTILKTEKFEQTKAPYIKQGVDKNYGGYYRPVHPEDELYEDGEFRNGKLWNGKRYSYDEDGILIKIEIWKEGNYYSDGQL
jgi:antitoxin component YwqK of YwqJK toxin-antitoxin module